MSKTPVSSLQEFLLRKGVVPQYDLLESEGIGTHMSTFYYRVLALNVSTIGKGKTKKGAKHEAARLALEAFHEIDINRPEDITPAPSRTKLRRSKSVPDLSTKSNIGFNKQPATTSTVSKPLKRYAVLDINPVLNKITKQSKPEPLKPKSIVPNIPPYDYKARFNHLNEIHEKLKETCRELKEQHEILSDQNEELTYKNIDLQNNYNKLETELTRKNHLLESKLKEFEYIKRNNIDTKKQLKVTNEQLEDSLKLNAVIK